MNDPDILITVTVVSLTLFIFVVVYLLLLSSNANRKNKHRVELADMRLNMQQELMQAEREATRTTMADIGQELHDNVGQLLTAAQLGFLYRFEDELPQDEQLRSIMVALDEGIEQVSRLGRSLNTDIWKERTLFESICETAAQVERLGKGVVHVQQTGGEPALSAEEKVILFRAFQEVLSNAMKHAKASTISIKLQESPLRIEVSDNGRGFDMENVSTGSGLLNIRKRCAYVNVHAELITRSGGGCRWTFYRERNEN